ncbi:hypothetical protein [Streptomyces sp. NPDC006527]|uniref:hypothetical protein n=1 Tax=Streptomyces sp. NPDC006527 TaxID=3364749 RepID=UPI0036C5FE85
MAELVRRLLAPGGVGLVTTPLTGGCPRSAAPSASPEDVATVTGRWNRGHWYDLEPGGLRCFVLRD